MCIPAAVIMLVLPDVWGQAVLQTPAGRHEKSCTLVSIRTFFSSADSAAMSAWQGGDQHCSTSSDLYFAAGGTSWLAA